jgi:hypothetical protein
MSFEQNMVLDATTGSMARFVNHSCEPNCNMRKWTVNGQPRVALFAERAIMTGEELTYDYNFSPFGKPKKCLCGSEKCRGIIDSRQKDIRKEAKADAKESAKAVVKKRNTKTVVKKDKTKAVVKKTKAMATVKMSAKAGVKKRVSTKAKSKVVVRKLKRVIEAKTSAPKRPVVKKRQIIESRKVKEMKEVREATSPKKVTKKATTVKSASNGSRKTSSNVKVAVKSVKKATTSVRFAVARKTFGSGTAASRKTSKTAAGGNKVARKSSHEPSSFRTSLATPAGGTQAARKTSYGFVSPISGSNVARKSNQGSGALRKSLASAAGGMLVARKSSHDFGPPSKLATTSKTKKAPTVKKVGRPKLSAGARAQAPAKPRLLLPEYVRHLDPQDQAEHTAMLLNTNAKYYGPSITAASPLAPVVEVAKEQGEVNGTHQPGGREGEARGAGDKATNTKNSSPRISTETTPRDTLKASISKSKPKSKETTSPPRIKLVSKSKTATPTTAAAAATTAGKDGGMRLACHPWENLYQRAPEPSNPISTPAKDPWEIPDDNEPRPKEQPLKMGIRLPSAMGRKWW